VMRAEAHNRLSLRRKETRDAQKSASCRYEEVPPGFFDVAARRFMPGASSSVWRLSV
jgi:hypothetical protein